LQRPKFTAQFGKVEDVLSLATVLVSGSKHWTGHRERTIIPG
jgi:hypothetical protein